MVDRGRRMKLDPRIKSIDSIRSFNTNNDDCLGKFGYFTNYITNFDDLNEVRKGICVFKDGCRFPFYADSIEKNQKFQFFIPENELLPKEKQYRALTIDEFLDRFDIGEVMVIRSKAVPHYVYHVLFVGYLENGKNDLNIILGQYRFSLQELFSDYEYKGCGANNWFSFGVEE